MSRIDDYNYYNDPRTFSYTKHWKVIKKGSISTLRLDLECIFSEELLEGYFEWCKRPTQETTEKVKAEMTEGDFAIFLNMKNELFGDEAGCRDLIKVKAEREICDLCNGWQKVVNPSIDCGGLTQDDFDEDPDFRDEYFSGAYDIQCPQCRGLGMIDVPHFPDWLAEVIIQREQEDEADARTRRFERAMGA